MIIPFTDRLKTKPVLIFALIVFLVQFVEKTDITFCLLTFVFTILSAVAYNVAGGLSYPSGAYILFNALFTVTIGLTFKLFLLEPGESNLRAPNTTLLAYCAGMIVMGLAAALSHRLRPKLPLLPSLDVENMRYAALGCLFAGILVQVLSNGNTSDAGSFSSALHQLNYLPRMALIFAIIYELNRSGGKRTTNWIFWLAGFFLFIFGIIEFSKEGMFTVPFTWLLTAILYRFRFSWKQILTLIVFAIFAEFILIPFSQYGRRSRASATTTRLEATKAAIEYLEDPLGTRALYLNDISAFDTSDGPHLYTTEHPFEERMIMIAFDDAIIARTDQGYAFGLMPTLAAYINVVPRFIWKDKPDVGFGNVYGHELGVLAEDDTSTGISFSPIADAYHQAKWFGIFFVWPPIIFIYFFITDSLTGSVRDSPYALLPIALAAHVAPEDMMAGAIYLQTYGAFMLILTAFLAKQIFARFTRIALGGDRTRVEFTRDFIIGLRHPAQPPGDPVDPSRTT